MVRDVDGTGGAGVLDAAAVDEDDGVRNGWADGAIDKHGSDDGLRDAVAGAATAGGSQREGQQDDE